MSSFSADVLERGKIFYQLLSSLAAVLFILYIDVSSCFETPVVQHKA
jgi:hypothetical protein